MKMKRLLLAGIVLAASSSAQAQSGTRIQAGINLANVSVTDNGRVNSANRLTTFQVGLIADWRLGGILYLQPGVLFTGKGSKVENGTPGTNGYFRQTFNPYYIEIPANVVAKVPLGGNMRFFAGAGPYLGVGLTGKVKTEGQNLGVAYTANRDITFSSDDPTTFNQEEGTGLGVIRRFDYGLNGVAGIEGKSTVLSVGYGHGLAKLQSGTNSGQDNNNKHRVWSLTLGFKF
jgi:hypothetical protein